MLNQLEKRLRGWDGFKIWCYNSVGDKGMSWWHWWGLNFVRSWIDKTLKGCCSQDTKCQRTCTFITDGLTLYSVLYLEIIDFWSIGIFCTCARLHRFRLYYPCLWPCFLQIAQWQTCFVGHRVAWHTQVHFLKKKQHGHYQWLIRV